MVTPGRDSDSVNVAPTDLGVRETNSPIFTMDFRASNPENVSSKVGIRLGDSHRVRRQQGAIDLNLKLDHIGPRCSYVKAGKA
eukprot:g55371.t1